MSRTFHHHAQGSWHLGRETASYRRGHTKLWKARCKRLVRAGKYDLIPPLKRKMGYFW